MWRSKKQKTEPVLNLAAPTSLDEWLAYIAKLHPKEIELGLERVQPVAECMGLLQFPWPVITVAGTNGKGSCVCLLESIYQAAGYRTAAYTSPHLLRFNERLRIDGQEPSDETLAAAFAAVERQRGDYQLSYFEYTTLAILHICKGADLDVMLLEVGLGGRLDAVNVVHADLALITAIDIDHTDYLGSTRHAIGAEKAGIFKPDQIAVCGDPDVPLSIVERAHEVGVSLYCLNRDYFYQDLEDSWNWSGLRTSLFNLNLPQLKLQNAATSLMVVELMAERLPVDKPAILVGLKNANLPGRFEEIITEQATIIFDVAHNPQAVNYLAENLRARPIDGKTRAVFGMLRDKDIQQVVATISPEIDEWYVASLSADRAATAESIVEFIRAAGQENCYTFTTVAEAMAKAIESSQPQDRIVIFGSFYTVAGAKQYLAQSHETTEFDTVDTKRFRVTTKLKQRVVGILVLLGLAALFLPLLFNNPRPVNNEQNLPAEAPKPPAMPQVQLHLASSTGGESSPQATESVLQPGITNAISQAINSSTPSSSSAPTSTPQAEIATTDVAEPPVSTPAAATVIVAQPQVDTATDAATSVIVKPAASKSASANKAGATPDAWVIQLGSFSNQATVDQLVKKLRAQGLEVYTQVVVAKTGKITRVFVGPLINETKIKQVQMKLQQDLKLNGVIKKYPVSN